MIKHQVRSHGAAINPSIRTIRNVKSQTNTRNSGRVDIPVVHSQGIAALCRKLHVGRYPDSDWTSSKGHELLILDGGFPLVGEQADRDHTAG